MEDRFDVVPVRVNDERCVIPGVVMRAKTRRAIVAAAGFGSGAVELVDGGSVGCGEGHMTAASHSYQEVRPCAVLRSAGWESPWSSAGKVIGFSFRAITSARVTCAVADRVFGQS